MRLFSQSMSPSVTSSNRHMDRGAWRVIVHGVTKNQTRVNYWTTPTGVTKFPRCSPCCSLSSSQRYCLSSCNFYFLIFISFIFAEIIEKVPIWLDQFSSVIQSCSNLCDPMDCSIPASLSITNSWSLLKLISIESVMPSNHLILCRPLLILPSIFPSIGSFQMSQLFASGGQNSGASASTSVLSVNTQDWSPLGWTGWISLQSKALSSVM